jgi:hypothetical protein
MTIAATANRIHDTATGTARASSRGQTRFMVIALMVSVASCMLNASMLSPAIRDINAHLGPHGYAALSTYFHLSGAICTVVLIVAHGTKAGFDSALWICVAIGVAALVASIILKPKPLAAEPESVK